MTRCLRLTGDAATSLCEDSEGLDGGGGALHFEFGRGFLSSPLKNEKRALVTSSDPFCAMRS